MRGQVRTHPGDGAIADLARRQHGVVARAQLAALGLGRDAIDWRVRRRRLHTVHRGVYRRTLERAFDEAQYLGLDFEDARPRHGRSGSGRLSSVLAVHRPGTTRTRSELEELFLELCDDHGLPRPEVNVQIEGFECDFVWREARLVVETDGAAAHGTSRARARDPVRDARLMTNGWRVWRLSYEQVVRGRDGVAKELEALLTPAPLPAALVAPHPR